MLLADIRFCWSELQCVHLLHAFPLVMGLQVKKEMFKWEMHKQKWELFKRGQVQGKVKSKYLGVCAHTGKNGVSGWDMQYMGRRQQFKEEEEARAACDKLIAEDDKEEGKGSAMTNACFWLEDSDSVTQRWKDRTDALASYYERLLAAGWPEAGECGPCACFTAHLITLLGDVCTFAYCFPGNPSSCSRHS